MKIRFIEKSTFGMYPLKNATICILLLTLTLVYPLLSVAKETTGSESPTHPGAITDIAAAQDSGTLTVTVKTDRVLEPKTFRLDNPPRLVVDFQNAINKVPFMQLPLNTAAARKLRVSQFQSKDPVIARLVFDLGEEEVDHTIVLSEHSVKVTLQEAEPSDKSKETPSVSSLVSDESPETVDTPVETIPAPTETESAATASVEPNDVADTADEEGLTEEETSSNPVLAESIEPVPVEMPSGTDTPAESAATVSVEPNDVADTADELGLPEEETSSDPVLAESVEPDPVEMLSGTDTPVELIPDSVETDPDLVASLLPADTAVVSDSPTPAAAGTLPDSVEPEAAEPVSVEKSANVETPSIPYEPKADPEFNTPEPVPSYGQREVPALIASLSNPSIVSSQAAGNSGNNSTTSRFSGYLLTLDLVDLPLVDFFRVMSEEAGINIVLDPKVSGSISIKVDKLPWDQIFDMVLVNNSLDKQIEGNLIRVAQKSTLQEEAKQREALKKAELLAADLETRVKRLNYAKAEDLIGALEDLKTVRGTVVHDVRTNSLVLTDIPDSINKMSELITTLDIPQPQVEIEARIVSAARDFARDIGVQFGFVKGNLERITVGGPNTFGTIGGTRPSATPKSTYVAGNPLSGRGASDDTTSESGAISTGEAGNYNVNLPAGKAFGGLGISIGNIFDTFLLDAALTAGESKGLAKLISQPKVTAQNNSPAVISQGTRFPVLVRANNTTTVQFYNAALTLTVTPQITYEGNIVLDLRVENNTADWGRTVESVPSIRISESESRVLVSDGGTTVIGGILIDEDSNSGDKVPGLGSLPLIGNLFRRTSVSRNSQEVLFFVTPHIVK